MMYQEKNIRQLRQYYRKIIEKYLETWSSLAQISLTNSQHQHLMRTIQQIFNLINKLIDYSSQIQSIIKNLSNQDQFLILEFEKNHQLMLKIIRPEKIELEEQYLDKNQDPQNDYCCQIHLIAIKKSLLNIINFFKPYLNSTQNIFEIIKKLSQNINKLLQELSPQWIECKQINNQQRKPKQRLDLIRKVSKFGNYPSLYSPMQFIYNKKFKFLTIFHIMQSCSKSSFCKKSICSFKLFQFIYLNRQSLHQVKIQGIQIINFEEFIKFFRVLTEIKIYRFSNNDSQINSRILESMDGQNEHILEQKYIQQSRWVNQVVIAQFNFNINIEVRVKYHFNKNSRQTSTIKRIRIKESMEDLNYFNNLYKKINQIEIIVEVSEGFIQISEFQQLLMKLEVKQIQITIKDVSSNDEIQILSEESLIYKLISLIQNLPEYNISSLKFQNIRFKTNEYKFGTNFRKKICKILQNNNLVYLGSIKSSFSYIIWEIFKCEKQSIRKIQCDNIQVMEDQKDILNEGWIIDRIIKEEVIMEYYCNYLSINVIQNIDFASLKNHIFYSSHIVSITHKSVNQHNSPYNERWLKTKQLIKLQLFQNLQILMLKNIQLPQQFFKLYFPSLEKLHLQQCLIKNRSHYYKLKYAKTLVVCIKQCQIQQENIGNISMTQRMKYLSHLTHGQRYTRNILLAINKKQDFPDICDKQSQTPIPSDQQIIIEQLQEQQKIIKKVTLPFNCSPPTRQYFNNFRNSIKFANKLQQQSQLIKYNYQQIDSDSFKIISERGFSYDKWSNLKSLQLKQKYISDMQKLLDQLNTHKIFHLDLFKRNIIIAINRQQINKELYGQYTEKQLQILIKQKLDHIKFQLIDYKHTLFLQQQSTLAILKILTLNKSIEQSQQLNQNSPFTQLIVQIIRNFPNKSSRQFEDILNFIHLKRQHSYDQFRKNQGLFL